MRTIGKRYALVLAGIAALTVPFAAVLSACYSPGFDPVASGIDLGRESMDLTIAPQRAHGWRDVTVILRPDITSNAWEGATLRWRTSDTDVFRFWDWDRNAAVEHGDFFMEDDGVTYKSAIDFPIDDESSLTITLMTATSDENDAGRDAFIIARVTLDDGEFFEVWSRIVLVLPEGEPGPGDLPDLPTPSGLGIVGTVLSWNPVENAAGYRVYADGAPVSPQVSATEFDLDDASPALAQGSHQISVMAIANPATHNDSPRSTAVTFEVAPALPPLSAPFGLVIAGTVLSWNPVEHAAGYRVYADGEPVSSQVSATNFDLDDASPALAQGSHQISVMAIANPATHSDSPRSTAVDFVVLPALSAPSGLSIAVTVLSWDPVENAVGYRVYADGVPVSSQLSATDFDLDDASPALAQGSHQISVVAIANPATHNDSPRSAEVPFVVP